MANPIKKIGIGLDLLEANARGNRLPKLAKLAGNPSTISDLKKLRTEITLAHEGLERIRVSMAKSVDLRTTEIREHFGQLGKYLSDTGTTVDEIGPQARRGMVDRALRSMAKEEAEKVKELASGFNDKIKNQRTALEAARASWGSPVEVLMRQTLSSERRATYTANLASAGPIEVAAAMSEAARMGGAAGKDLAAACCTRFDSMGKASEGVGLSKLDVCEALIYGEFNEAVETLGLSDYFLTTAESAAVQIEGKAVSSVTKMKAGRILHDLEQQLGKTWDGMYSGVGDSVPPKDEPVENDPPAEPEKEGRPLGPKAKALSRGAAT